MKFAVKTVTCLGCRTVLRTNKGLCSIPLIQPSGLTPSPDRRSRLRELQTSIGRIVPETGKWDVPPRIRVGLPYAYGILLGKGRLDLGAASRLCPALDSMPAMSRISAPGGWIPLRAALGLLILLYRTCCVQVPIAPSFIEGRQDRRKSSRRSS